MASPYNKKLFLFKRIYVHIYYRIWYFKLKLFWGGIGCSMYWNKKFYGRGYIKWRKKLNKQNFKYENWNKISCCGVDK